MISWASAVARHIRRGTVAFLATGLVVAGTVAVTATEASASPGDITTVAGGGLPFGVGDTLALARHGNTLYIGEWRNYVIARDLTTGDQTTFAGTIDDMGHSGDGGPATDAQLTRVTGLATDAAGTVYIAENDDGNNLCDIRKVDATTHNISLYAGGGMCASTGNGGPALSADLMLNQTGNLSSDAAGNLYLTVDNTVRRIDHTTHTIDLAFGDPTTPNGYQDGAASTAQFRSLSNTAIDAAGNIYVADRGSHAVRKVSADLSTVSTIVGGSINSTDGNQDGPVASAEFGANWPQNIGVSPTGALYMNDAGNGTIRMLSADGTTVSTVMGTGTPGNAGDGGLATSAQTWDIRSFQFTADGNEVYLDQENHGGPNFLRVIHANGIVDDATGPMDFGEGGPATDAVVGQPIDLARGGRFLYILDQGSVSVEQLDLTTDIITTIVGNHTSGSAGDGGPALDAQLQGPRALAYDPAGNGSLLIAGTDARIRKVDLGTHIITTLVGNGTSGFVDGALSTAQISDGVTGLAVTTDGRIIIADTNNRRVRCIGCVGTGIINTIAGNGTMGSSADGTVATASPLISPIRVVLAPNGDVVFADMCDVNAVLIPLFGGPGTPTSTCDARVREILSNGRLKTLAGTTGDSSGAGDGGPATSASLAGVISLRYDAAGNLFIGEMGGSFLDFMMAVTGHTSLTTIHPDIRKVDAVTGTISNFAGNGTFGFAGDGGPATAAEFSVPTAISPDQGTHLFVADLINGRIRRIEGAKPDLVTAMHGGPFTEGTDGTLRVTETNNGVGWLTGPVTATITLPTALTFKAASGDGWTCDADGQTVTCTNPANMAPGASSSFDITVGVATGAPSQVDVAAVSSSDSDVVDAAHQSSVLGIEITRADSTAPTTTVPAAAPTDANASAGTPAGTLPMTGGSVTGLLIAAALFLLFGAGLTTASRRRRPLTHSATYR